MNDFINKELEKYKNKKIYTFVDFGNVNYWYERDERNFGDKLPKEQKLVVDIEKLANFISCFSEEKRFYFGLDKLNKKSIRIISKARQHFNKTITKSIQYIRHYINISEEKNTTRAINHDDKGKKFIHIPKCNFDTEICVDAVRFLNNYDVFCLFSSDADFAYLIEFLRRNKKKIILFSAGHISYQLKRKADLNINAQQIKDGITFLKQKPRL